MKKIVVITNFMSVALLHQSVLSYLFQDGVEITCFAFDQDKIDSEIDADVLLISIYPIYVNIKDFVRITTKVIILSSTISEEQFMRIKQIPSGSQVLLVNYSPEMTVETLALFRQIGLTEYDFVTYYPGKLNPLALEFAVTPGEAALVPIDVKTVIDIGHRTLDIRTLIDVTLALDLEALLNERRFIEHFKSLKSASYSVTTLLDRANINEDRFLKLMDVMDEGIIVISGTGAIYAMNKKACGLLKQDSACVGANIGSLLPIDLKDVARLNSGKLLQIKDCRLSVKSYPIYMMDLVTSIFLVINRFEDQERSQHLLRRQIVDKGHRAKYQFEDIIGNSSMMVKLIDIAKKMSRSEAGIFISGESGTGKELFAQAIHNTSLRKDSPFVAVNCAAIPEALLESELFGYEEGAFSGAKKGGKLGLFELAHQGSIFLDEIGEMPIQLQSRLLRVIEEKEVMRVGGNRVIPIDVRIIAATNQNLKGLIEKHKFRLDLYYRLNVLNLHLPPLRERTGDLEILFDRMKKGIGAHYQLSKAAEQAFLNHPWEGNLRELRNVVEYLAYLEKGTIEFDDLPQELAVKYVAPIGVQVATPIISPTVTPVETPVVTPAATVDIKQFIFSCLWAENKKSKGIGRRKISELAHLSGYMVTEGEIRTLLHRLSEEGDIVSVQSRKGSYLTPKGLQYYKDHYESINTR